MLWYDTTNAVVKQRNATNTGWITRWTVANAEGTLGTNLLFTPDNTYDIGASGATRPRDLFLGRNATIGGTLGVTGTSTLAAINASGVVTVSGAGLFVTGTIASAAANQIALDYNSSKTRVVSFGPSASNYNPLTFVVVDSAGAGIGEVGRFSTGGYLKASPTASYAGSTGVYHELVQTSTTASDQALAMWHVATAGDNKFILFGTEGSFTSRGSISYNRAGVVVAYNTTSDYRLKDLFGEYADSGALIDAIPVHYGLMKEATVKRPMFLAHEVQAAAPYAVMGEKDAIDDEGEPVYQQLDHQILVPALWAEMRSMRKRVATLEGATLH
jgi:hypothetical protein